MSQHDQTGPTPSEYGPAGQVAATARSSRRVIAALLLVAVATQLFGDGTAPWLILGGLAAAGAIVWFYLAAWRRTSDRLLAQLRAAGALAGAREAVLVQFQPPGQPGPIEVLRRGYWRRVSKAAAIVLPGRLAIRPDARGRRKGWSDFDLPFEAIREVVVERGPTRAAGSWVYVGLSDGSLTHFVTRDTDRLVAALRAEGVTVAGA